jgi:hypothetical protein
MVIKLLDYKSIELAFGETCATLRNFACFAQLYVNHSL